eukprot:10541110-Ditylum_brightwellii.AAC.1
MPSILKNLQSKQNTFTMILFLVKRKATTRFRLEENHHVFKQIELRLTSSSILTTDSSAIILLPDNIALVAKKIILSPHCPKAILHMGDFSKSSLKAEWRAYI